MTKEAAIKELEAVAEEMKALYAAARAAGGGCWWCCGGGDEWRDELEARKAAVLSQHPDLA